MASSASRLRLFVMIAVLREAASRHRPMHGVADGEKTSTSSATLQRRHGECRAGALARWGRREKGGVSDRLGNRLRPVDITTESTETTDGPSAPGREAARGRAKRATTVAAPARSGGAGEGRGAGPAREAFRTGRRRRSSRRRRRAGRDGRRRRAPFGPTRRPAV